MHRRFGWRNLSYTGIMSFKSAEELSSEAGFEISDFDESLLPFSVTQKIIAIMGTDWLK